MYELFIELTDELFWPGYAQQLAQDDPRKFKLEYEDFLRIY